MQPGICHIPTGLLKFTLRVECKRKSARVLSSDSPQIDTYQLSMVDCLEILYLLESRISVSPPRTLGQGRGESLVLFEYWPVTGSGSALASVLTRMVCLAGWGTCKRERPHGVGQEWGRQCSYHYPTTPSTCPSLTFCFDSGPSSPDPPQLRAAAGSPCLGWPDSPKLEHSCSIR